MSGKIVCNASPLIFLSKINRLHLLSDFFDEVLVPSGAWDEVIRKPDDMTDTLNQLRASKKITVFTVQNRAAISAMIGRLHIGEVEVIVGAGELDISDVILDDGYARSKAKQMGLAVTGTLGILIAGQKRGLINNLAEEIDKLRSIGFRISDKIVEQVLKQTHGNG
jgi:predicted nucleic acid-binding protein